MERRRRVYGLWKCGATMANVAQALGIKEATVYKDVQFVERLGLGGPGETGGGITSVDKTWAGVKLWSELEVIKQEALNAWSRSIKPRKKRVKKAVSGEKDTRQEESTTIETTAGDPRFLNVAQSVIHDQALLVGLIDDAKQGRGMAKEAVDTDADDTETIAIIEVTSRDQARALEGKRYCRVAEGVGESVEVPAESNEVIESPAVAPEPAPVEKPASLAGIVGAKMRELPNS